MQLRLGGAVLATALFALSAAPAAMAAREPLNAYRVAATAANKSKLALEGYDMVEADRGSLPRDLRNGQAGGVADAGRARAQARRQGQPGHLAGRRRPVGSDAAYNVWRRYDRVPGDTKEQYLELYDRLEGSSIVKKLKIGTTHMGRDIIALKVTQNAKTRTDNTRPAVLYNAMQHAREWLAGETCRRTLLYFTQNYDTTPDNPSRKMSPSSSTRASCGSRASTTRTATSTRSRPATACGARTWPTTTATACAARPSTASTRTATTPPTGA